MPEDLDEDEFSIGSISYNSGSTNEASDEKGNLCKKY
jgi:hypothetical protein